MEDIVRSFGLLTLGSRMKRIGERLQSESQAIADRHGASVQTSQYPFLAALDRLGPLTVGEIAQAVGITQPGATRSIGQLAKAGYVSVRRGAKDQRHREVSLTRKGIAEVALARDVIWPHIETAVADLCRSFDRKLLDQLGRIEDGLADRPLIRRAGDKAGERP